MVVNIDLKDLLNWYTQEDKIMEFKDKLMVRGAGLLWIPLFWLQFIACIVIGTESYNKFVLYTIILPALGFLVLGIIFSIVEIYRISILNKYEQYTKIRLKEYHKALGDDYENLVQKEAQSLFKFLDGAAAIITQAKVEHGEIKSRIQALQNSLSIFRQKYFNKKDED